MEKGKIKNKKSRWRVGVRLFALLLCFGGEKRERY